MMETQTFECHHDPAHGWVKVPISLINELGLAGEIFPYSYWQGDYAYLEEDCDATLFVNLVGTLGIEPTWVDRYTDSPSPIRSMERWHS